MTRPLSWSDTFNRMVVPDTISYQLPEGLSVDAAPSELVIDGFATLKMHRTRISTHHNETLEIVDEVRRSPLRAQVIPATTPLPTAPGPARVVRFADEPAAVAGPAPQHQGGAPLIGVGAGNAERDNNLFTARQMFLFGAGMSALALGCAIVVANPWLGAGLIVAGLITMALAVSNPLYHVIGARAPAPPAPERAQEPDQAVEVG